MNASDEAMKKARELATLLKAIPFSSDREKVLDVLKEAVCFKCADLGCDGWCDYESRPGD